MAQPGFIYAAHLEPVQWKIADGCAIECSARSEFREVDIEGMRQIRNRFLGVQRGEEGSLLNFLNREGAWARYDSRIPLANIWVDHAKITCLLTGLRPEGFPISKSLAQMELGRELLKHLQLHSIRTHREYPTELELAVFDVRGALYISTWQDLLRDVKFRYCAREDCPDHNPKRTPFEVTRPDRVYCSTYCGHLVSLRRKRASARTKFRHIRPR